MKSKKIGIIGGSQGIGSWLVNFLSENGCQVAYSSDDGLGDFLTNIQLVVSVDIVVLAVPISAMEEVLDEIYPYLQDRVLVDVCSVKTNIVSKFQALHETYPRIVSNYISLHPMFGPSVRSVKGQVVLFNYFHGEKKHLAQMWKDLFSQHDAIVYDIDYQEHDRMMGIIQGLNHFNVFVSAKTLADLGGNLATIKKLSSPSYHIFIIFFARYVMQNPRLYAEIQIYNPYVKEVVQKFMEEAKILLQTIEQKDIAAFENYVMSIRPFFKHGQEDAALSNTLVATLGELLAEKSAVLE